MEGALPGAISEPEFKRGVTLSRSIFEACFTSVKLFIRLFKKNLSVSLFFVDRLPGPVCEKAQKIALFQDLLRLSQILCSYRFFLRHILSFKMNHSTIFSYSDDNDMNTRKRRGRGRMPKDRHPPFRPSEEIVALWMLLEPKNFKATIENYVGKPPKGFRIKEARKLADLGTVSNNIFL